MTLQQMKPLSSVSLEHAIKIALASNIHPEEGKEWSLDEMTWTEKGMIFHAGVVGMYFEDNSIGSECFPIPAVCYVTAHSLGYYVPVLSEELKIKELEGKLEVYKIIYSRTGFHSPEIIDELKKTN